MARKFSIEQLEAQGYRKQQTAFAVLTLFVIAVLLSVFCCSVAGQFYNGQFLKGIIMLVAAVGLAVVTGGLTALLTWPLFAVDAGMVASRLNRGEPVSEWQFF